MTPTDEATFIALWQQGASYREIAAALRCPLGTVGSRAEAVDLTAEGCTRAAQVSGNGTTHMS